MSTNNETSTLEIRVEQPSAAALQKAPAAALALVESFEVVDGTTYEIAGEELTAIKKKATDLDAKRKAITKPMDEAKKAVMDLFREPLEILERAERLIKGKMLAYQQAEQAKANEARLAAERAAQAERERLAAEAKKLEDEGRAGEAAIKRTVAEMVVAAPPVAAVEPVKAKGVSTRTTVDYEVVDLHALIKHVAEHPELVQLLIADSVKLRAYVRGVGMACALPGVRVFESQTLSASRK